VARSFTCSCCVGQVQAPPLWQQACQKLTAKLQKAK
jgi:hypothetical protein